MIPLSSKFNQYKNQIILFFIIGLFRIFYYFSMPSLILASDSENYIHYSFENLLSLNITNIRTPVYPLLIHLCRYISKQSFLNIVVVIQMICSFLSVLLFYKICKIFMKHHQLIFIFVVLYGCNPQIFAWDKAILTESLALSGTMAFLYLMASYLMQPSAKKGGITSILLLILTFLRPTFMMFLVFHFIFLILRYIFKLYRQTILPVLCLSFLGIVTILIYSWIYQQSTGLFSITSVMPQQLLYVSINEGFYQNGSDEQMIQDINKILANNESGKISSVTETWNFINHYGLKDTQDFAVKSFINSSKNYAYYLTQTMLKNGSALFPNGYINGQENPYKNGSRQFYVLILSFCGSIFSVLKIGHTYLFALLELFSWWYYRKDCLWSWFHMGLGIFMISIIISTFVATNGAFDRTMIHIIPFTYLSTAFLLNSFLKYIKENSL